jgi:hypothetical protein
MTYSISLSLGATIGDIDAVANAVKSGADINQKDGEALIEAIKANDMRMVEILVELGANVNQPQYGLWGIPLKAAAETGNVEILTYLLDHGADRYDEAIGAAVSLGKTDILRTLKDKGIALQVQSQHLTYCLSMRYEETALYLVENGHELTDHQVLTAVYNELNQVLNYLTHKTDYLPSQATYDSLMGSKYEWFLHAIANRELNKTLNRVMTPRFKEQVRKI